MQEVVEYPLLLAKRATAARMLDCSPSTIHKLIVQGKLDTAKVGDDLRVTVDSIKRYATQRAA